MTCYPQAFYIKNSTGGEKKKKKKSMILRIKKKYLGSSLTQCWQLFLHLLAPLQNPSLEEKKKGCQNYNVRHKPRLFVRFSQDSSALPPGLPPAIQMHATTSKGSLISPSSTRKKSIARNFNIRELFSIADELKVIFNVFTLRVARLGPRFILQGHVQMLAVAETSIIYSHSAAPCYTFQLAQW